MSFHAACSKTNCSVKICNICFAVYQVKVTKGGEKVTGVFNEEIAAWTENFFRGRSDQLA